MNNRPIGMFDSGVGGLTVYKEVKKNMPQEQIIYLGDTYKNIKIQRWNEAREYELSTKVKTIKPKEIKIT